MSTEVMNCLQYSIGSCFLCPV